jgi:beta-lactamase class D
MAIYIQVQVPKYKGGSWAKAALKIVAEQIKVFLKNLQMIDKSTLLVPFSYPFKHDTASERTHNYLIS